MIRGNGRTRGKSVINYVLLKKDKREKIKNMEVADNIESDHYLLIVVVKGAGGSKVRLSERKGKKKKLNRGVWDEEGRERFKS